MNVFVKSLVPVVSTNNNMSTTIILLSNRVIKMFVTCSLRLNQYLW